MAGLYLEKCPAKLLPIQGRAYEMPTPELNALLSELCAGTIRHEFERRGIPLARLIATGRGDTLPLTPADAPDRMRTNRRVVLRVVD